MRGSIAERFWSKVEKTDGCWLWRGSRTGGGYGNFHLAGKSVRASRASWLLEHGSMPELDVLHDCDVKACVRPSHLHLGDDAMNQREAEDRGRMNRAVGERHPSAKMTVGKVHLLRSLRARGVTQRALADHFGIDTTSVVRILNGRNWSSA